MRSRYRLGDRVPRQPLGGGAGGRPAPAALLRSPAAASRRQLDEMVDVGFEDPRQPAVSNGPKRESLKDVRVAPIRHPASGGQNSSVGPPAVAITGQAAGHCLQHRHREALAAIGVDEHVTAAVQRGELRLVELFVQELDAGQRAAGGVGADRGSVAVPVDRRRRRSP